jgi:type II restriction/modification system DNA methylase subunit YeeA
MWIIDFGWELSEREASLFETPFQHIKQKVYPERSKNRRDSYRNRWWRHVEPRPALLSKLKRLRRYIVTATVAKHRLFIWLDSIVLPDHQLIVIARDDDTTFGIIHSRFHETWSLRLGTWLGVGNDPRYTPTTTFETFPFPADLTPNTLADNYGGDPRAIMIAEAAKRLDRLRNAWLNPPDLVRIEPEVVPGYPDRIVPKDTVVAAKLRERTLTKLYNEGPQWLVDAHRDLDAAVAAALARLLDLNLARAGVSMPAGFAEGAREPELGATLGREQFATISEVEGIRLSDAANAALVDVDEKVIVA